ncbi:MAG TPA: acyltransferase [Anaerolineales bacterium]|nr:acyltransferase [Anaerolineales bacterium]
MTGNAVVPTDSTSHTKSGGGNSDRLYYLDWLRVILLFGVFVYHVLKIFYPFLPWHINNVERSDAVMGILLTINPWGIPLFFLVAGAGSWFALRRRNNRQFIGERVNRLLIPFIVGSILLTPFQKYLEALHKDTYEGSFLSFLPEMLADFISRNWFTPLIFPRWGLHLWFLGFLFAFSLLAIPFYSRFKKDTGGSFISWLARFVKKRGGIFIFVIPLALSRILVQPFVPNDEHGWLDFVYFFFFFVLGYIIYSDERFQNAIRRDRWLLLASGIAGMAVYFALTAVYGEDTVLDWGLTYSFPGSIVGNIVFTFISWGWTLYVLYLAMSRLNFSNRLLAYGNETIMPFYLLHQPVIIVVSYFVVQWDAGIFVKLMVILLTSLLIVLALIELLIRPFKPVRRLFGMKPRRRKEEEVKTAPA